MATYTVKGTDDAKMYATGRRHGAFEPNLYVRYTAKSTEETVRLLDTYAESVLEHRVGPEWGRYLDIVAEVYWCAAPIFLLEMSGNGLSLIHI